MHITDDGSESSRFKAVLGKTGKLAVIGQADQSSSLIGQILLRL